MKIINPFLILFLIVFSASVVNASDESQRPRDFLFNLDRKIYSLSEKTESIEMANRLRKITNSLTRFMAIKGITFDSKIKAGKALNGSDLELLYRFITTYRNLMIQAQINLVPVAPTSTPEQNLLYLHNHLKILQSLKTVHRAFFRPDAMRLQIHNAFRKAEQKSVNRDEVLSLINNFSSTNNQRRLRKIYKDLIVNGQSLSAEGEELVRLINRNSLSTNFHKSDFINIWTHTFFDGLARFGNDLEYMLSKGFGNVMGEIKFRKGFLYKHKEAHDKFKATLLPLDIIIERSPFALTDMTIPGHWTHPAIWLGTEEQLKELGLWDHPIFKPYQKMISEGRNVLEALRPGIEINPLTSYFNTDEILHMRVPGLLNDKKRMLAIYERGLSHFGQQYDFNFDSSSTDVIVCSELIFQAFGNINWNLDKVLGRHSITPDNVAEIMFYQDSPVKFVDIMGVNENKEIYHLQKEDVAQYMNFSIDKERTKLAGTNMFNKTITECSVRQTRIRVGSRREKHLKIHTCKDKLKPAVYTAE